MKLSDADLNLMVAFEALWEERSVSRSAERLGIGQPAMSATLARLRVLMADPLFTRISGRMQPTPKAVALAPAIRDALARLRALLADAVPFVPQLSRDVFTVASTDYTTLVLLPALMARLGQDAPGIDLRVIGYDKGDIAELLTAGRIDLALGVFPEAPANSVRQLLCGERFVGVARAGHPAMAAGGIDLDAFCQLPHALVTLRRDAVGAVDRALAAQGRERRVALSLPHMLALPPVLLRSNLIATLPERVAAGALCAGLQCFPLPVEVPSWNIEMLWSPAARVNPAVSWLRASVQAVAASV